MLVEPKGLTTSVHYRNVRSELWDDLARIVHEAVGDRDGQVRADHRPFRLGNPAACFLAQGPRAETGRSAQLGDGANRLVFYLGDDRTDEDAFACLPDAITVKVGSPGVDDPGPLLVARPRFRPRVPGVAREAACPLIDLDLLPQFWP